MVGLELPLILVAQLVGSALALNPFTEHDQVSLWTSSPVVLDTPLKAVAHLHLEDGDDEEKGPYRMQWRDDVSGPWSDWRDLGYSEEKKVIFQRTYHSATSEQGSFQLELKVSKKTFIGIEETVAETKAGFNLTKELNGAIWMNGAVLRASDRGRLAAKTPSNVHTNFTFKLHDPTNFFKRSLLNYFWFIDDINYGQTKEPRFQFTFGQPGRHTVGLSVIAYQSTYNSSKVNPDLSLRDEKALPFVKFGMFRAELESQAPITKLDKTGNTWMKQGELLDLTLHCDGSGPWNYCWTIHDPNYNITGNETCTDGSVLVESCNFPIMWYFRQFGSYSVLVIVSNGVSAKTELLHINVYEIHPQTPVAFFILPLMSGLGALIALVVGTIYIWGMRTSFILVEVADFDFATQEDQVMTEKTFLERLRDSMVTAFSSTSDTISHVSSISARSAQPSGGVAGIHYGSIS